MTQTLPNFTATPDSITADAQRLVEHSRRLRDELVRSIAPLEATFANVMLPLAQMENDFALQANILGFFRHVAEHDEIRGASTKAQTIFDNFQTESLMREDIFALVTAVHERGEALDPESSLFLKRVYEKHIRTGVRIQDATQRQLFKTTQARISQLKATVRENLALDRSHVSFTAAELEGVPDSVLCQLQRDDDGFHVTLSNPDHTDIMSYAEKSETRKRLFIACQNRCSENVPHLKEAVILRYQASQILGFPNHAAFRLGEKMAKTPDTVNEFLADLRSKLTPGGLDSLRTLKDLKEANMKRLGEADEQNDRFFLWDYDFYHQLLLDQQLSINRNQIKEYFPLQTTIVGMLKLFSHMFGLEFTELKGIEKTAEMVWHDDVQVFLAHDDQSSGGNFLGYLYVDLFHRRGKYPQPSCFSLQPGFTREDGSRHHPVTALLCNFPKPSLSKPSLLRHFDVVQMFHELGHGIHDLVSKTRYSRFHGPEGVAVDFGELPSQVLEQWCWTPSQLKYFSHHYSYLGPEMLALWKQENPGVSQPEIQMPDAAIESLIRSRRFTFGPLFYLDQVHRSTFDMAIHQVSSLEEAESIDLAVMWNKLRCEIKLMDGPEALGQGYAWGHGYTTFSHLVSNDYDAGYYAYLFSQVYAADVFYSKFKNNITDSERGKEYRRDVLEKGGSQDEMQTIVDFLGRNPSAKAFNESLLNLSPE